MASRTEKLRRRQHRKEKKKRHPRAAEWSGGGGLQPMVVYNPRGEVKMSEVLETLVDPEWDQCEDQEDFEKLLMLGMAGWNAALMQGAARARYLDDLAQTFPSHLRQDFHRLVEPYILRKELLFPDIQRPILSFQLTTTPEGEPYLTVISGLSR